MGDIEETFDSPTFAKARPITDSYSNTVLLPLMRGRKATLAHTLP